MLTSLSLCPELVVAESVVVIKKLLQMQPEKHSDIIKHMAKLTDNIQVRREPLTKPKIHSYRKFSCSRKYNLLVKEYKTCN